MTNLERIRKMTIKELIIFMKLSDFSGTFPIVEGHRCYTREELENWFLQEVPNSEDDN